MAVLFSAIPYAVLPCIRVRGKFSRIYSILVSIMISHHTSVVEHT